MQLDGRSGIFPFRTWKLWYGVVSGVGSSKPPLICVPGGPGLPHDAFESMVPAAGGRPLVFYDPSGSGRSERGAQVEWNLELFVDEVATLIEFLGLRELHLFGASLGALVCLSYALRKPRGLRSLALVGATPSMPASRAALVRQIEALPPEIRDPLLTKEGTPEYLRAYYKWAARHLCRVPFPRELLDAMARANMEAYHAMKGRGPIGFGGALQHVDLGPRLAELDLPTWLAHGHHDHLYPEIHEAMVRALPRGRAAVFSESAHMPQYEEPGRFMAALFGFLDEVDAG